MQLDHVRHQVQSGDLLLVQRSRWWGSYLIRARTASVYSHVGLALWVETEGTRRLMAVEATWPQGVRLLPLERFLANQARDGATVDWWALTDARVDRKQVAAYLADRLGEPYSLRQLLASWGPMTRWLRRRRQAAVDVGGAEWICSEIGARALHAGGYIHDEPLDPAETDPGSVARYTCVQRRGALLP